MILRYLIGMPDGSLYSLPLSDETNAHKAIKKFRQNWIKCSSENMKLFKLEYSGYMCPKCGKPLITSKTNHDNKWCACCFYETNNIKRFL